MINRYSFLFRRLCQPPPDPLSTSSHRQNLQYMIIIMMIRWEETVTEPCLVHHHNHRRIVTIHPSGRLSIQHNSHSHSLTSTSYYIRGHPLPSSFLEHDLFVRSCCDCCTITTSTLHYYYYYEDDVAIA